MGRTHGRAGALALLLAGALAAAPGESPITLADPNGQDLRLQRLDVRVATHGPLALTELELVFQNPSDRQVEGRFTCTLPTGATVSRFAKEVEGKLMEGEVVERLKATRIYTQILHTMRDPALLKQDQGNRFTARIFPIPPRDTVRLLLSYSSRNPIRPDGTRELAVPLAGLGEVERFTFRAVVRPLPGEEYEPSGWLGAPTRRVVRGAPLFTQERGEDGFTPPDDLRLVFRAAAGARRAHVLEAGDFRMLAYRPPAEVADPAGEPEEWRFVVDTSASGGLAAGVRLDALEAVLDAVSRGALGRTLTVEAFDLGVEPVAAWTAGEESVRGAVEALRERGFLGATHLERALRHVGETARASRRPRTFVLVTDGIPTAGAREPGELLEALGPWPPEQRMHVLVLGSTQDARVTVPLAEAARGRVVRVPLTTAFPRYAQDAAADFRVPLGETFRVENPGAAWVQPALFRDVQPGQEILAFASRSTTAADPFVFSVLDAEDVPARVEVEPLEVPDFAPLLEREAYRARLDLLETRLRETEDPDARRALKQEMIEVSTTHRVLCPLTAMLVLETEEDYARFGIDRRSLADILIVGDQGIVRVDRAEDLPPTALAEEKAKEEDAKPEHPPGRDPMIRVRAPPGTRRIVAVFPWGETKLLVRDPRTGTWQTRFLVPRGTLHGSYEVVLVLTLRDGSKKRLVFSFGADRRPPRGRGGGRARRDRDGWRVRLDLRTSPDTVRAEARLPNGKTLPLARAAGGERFEGSFTVGDEVGPSVLVPVTLFDRGHNRMTLEVEVELR